VYVVQLEQQLALPPFSLHVTSSLLEDGPDLSRLRLKRETSLVSPLADSDDGLEVVGEPNVFVGKEMTGLGGRMGLVASVAGRKRLEPPTCPS
jgi:hypothetical protein